MLQRLKGYLERLRLDRVVLVLSMMALLGWGVTACENREYFECQARVNDTVIKVLQLRSNADDEEQSTEVQADEAFRVAMDTLLANPPRSVQERRQVLVNLQRALDDQKAQRVLAERVRANNPIPELPSESCR